MVNDAAYKTYMPSLYSVSMVGGTQIENGVVGVRWGAGYGKCDWVR